MRIPVHRLERRARQPWTSVDARQETSRADSCGHRSGPAYRPCCCRGHAAIQFVRRAWAVPCPAPGRPRERPADAKAAQIARRCARRGGTQAKATRRKAERLSRQICVRGLNSEACSPLKSSMASVRSPLKSLQRVQASHRFSRSVGPPTASGTRCSISWRHADQSLRRMTIAANGVGIRSHLAPQLYGNIRPRHALCADVGDRGQLVAAPPQNDRGIALPQREQVGCRQQAVESCLLIGRDSSIAALLPQRVHLAVILR